MHLFTNPQLDLDTLCSRYTVCGYMIIGLNGSLKVLFEKSTKENVRTLETSVGLSGAAGGFPEIKPELHMQELLCCLS